MATCVGQPTESQLRYVLDRADTSTRHSLFLVWRAIKNAGGPVLYDLAEKNRLLSERQILDLLWAPDCTMAAVAQGVYSWMATKWFGDYPGATFATRVTGPGGSYPTLNLVAPRVKGIDGQWSQPYLLPPANAQSMPGISRGPNSLQTLQDAATTYQAHTGTPLTTIPTGTTQQDVITLTGGTYKPGDDISPPPMVQPQAKPAACGNCIADGLTPGTGLEAAQPVTLPVGPIGDPAGEPAPGMDIVEGPGFSVEMSWGLALLILLILYVWLRN
jgi:hypothetical protein